MKTLRSLAMTAGVTLAITSIVLGNHLLTPKAAPAPKAAAVPNLQMKAVLDQLKALGPKPIERLTPDQARIQPGPADAVKAILKKRNGGTLPPPEPVAKVQDSNMPTPTGAVPVRIYTPEGTGPFPVIVYIHGGGWVIAGIQAYDASARALANAAKSVVVSIGYHYAPEHPFPAAHEECYTVTQFVLKHAEQLNGDPKRVAIAGESAGGNMATAVCLMARDRKGVMPVYQLLVYPVTDTRMNTPSYRENARAKPLNRAMMHWFAEHTVESRKSLNSKYLAVLRNPNLKGLPPATVITAQIDPLRSEGKAYAERLKAAGVPVRYRNYAGVTHEFFGMGAVVDEAKNAVAFAAAGLNTAFK